jgi:hypothetical protein
MKRLAGNPVSAQRRNQAIVAIVASAAAVTLLAWAAGAGSTVARLNDFYREVAPAYTALVHGHVLHFLQLAPAYGGSLVLRAPFAVLPALWGASQRALFFWSAVPCVLADAAFCVWLAAQPRRGGISWGSRLVPVGFCVFSPVIIVALFDGHPEEVLGAVLCVGAVVLASDGRAGWAGVLMGLAVANKPWALVVVPVFLAALPAQRLRALLIAAATASVVLAPIFVARDHGLSAAANGSVIGNVFNPPQLLWWFGRNSWIVHESRPLIVAISAALAVLWRARRALRRPTASGLHGALLLLTLVLLLRAALDPWNNLYYHVPFLFALIALEVRAGRAPVVMAAYTFALLFLVPIAWPIHTSYDLRAGVYAALVLPMIVGLAIKLYAPGRGVLSLLPGGRRVRARLGVGSSAASMSEQPATARG